MRPRVNPVFVQAIRECRDVYLGRAGRAFVASHLTPPAVAAAYRLAELRWIDEHPTLADLIKESV